MVELTAEGYSLGLTVAEVGRQLRAAYDGKIVQIINSGGEEIEVRLSLTNANRENVLDINRLPIVIDYGKVVPLNVVAAVYPRQGIKKIKHRNADLAAKVLADVDNNITNEREIIHELQKSSIPLIESAYNVDISLGDFSLEKEEQLEKLKLGAIVSLVLIYVVLAWVFSSYTWPLAVMFTIPLGLIGAIFGHWVIGIDFTVLSILGFFALFGIVVNDAIVLITFYKEMRGKGVPTDEAIELAACQRFRAVLLTSVTTIVGLSAIFFEDSQLADYALPLPVTICAGLAFATVLTLIIVPVLLSVIESMNASLGNKKMTKMLVG